MLINNMLLLKVCFSQLKDVFRSQYSMLSIIIYINMIELKEKHYSLFT